MKTLYTAEVRVTGGRSGRARSSTGSLSVNLSTPTEMGGSGGDGTNPEQLFAAGYGACFESALMSAARRKKIDADQVIVTARVGIGPTGGGAYGLNVELRMYVPGVERSVAEELVAEADRICPYSNAVRGNVPVQLIVEEEEPASW
ncbi:MAG: organic hydroperoxide resistance protein [Chloroflexota bacterium]